MKSQVALNRLILFLLTSLGLLAVSHSAPAQDGVVDFVRDIQPIFESRCLQCHGEDLAEADLNLTDHDIVADYLEAGDPSSSDLFDVLVNEDRLMPPEDEGGPLAAGEIALIKLWIEEGAQWPDDLAWGTEAENGSTTPAPPEPETARVPPSQRPMAEKVWAFHGYFHPAVVHFPIALLTIAAMFILLHWVLRGNYREFAFYLLTLGALSSIVACTMGWAFAPERSMGGGIFDMNHKVFNHRWLGIIVAGLTTFLTIIALRARKSEKGSVQFLWQAGVLIAAGLVGIVGHQGGELVYGEGMYDKAFAKYFAPEEPGTQETQPTTDPATGPATSEETGTEEGAGEEGTTEEGSGEEGTSESTEETESETAPPVEVGGGDQSTSEENTGGSGESESDAGDGTGADGGSSDGGSSDDRG